MLEPGKVIGGKYVLERPAGFGGMAELWVATNQATDAPVCVKLLVRANEEESIERFRREAHAAAKLSHRAIVRVFDLLGLDVSGEATRRGPPHAYAIVMELLHGETLGDLLAKRGKLPLEEALDLFLPVVSALAHAHRASVIHRDIKPDNIFLAVDPDGHVAPKVLDFGVSKMSNAEAITNDGVVVGTPSFMSPEQAKGARHVDARSDVFSAGVLLYVMLAGANPFEDRTFAGGVDAVIRREVQPLTDVPPAIWAILDQAIQKDPGGRFSDATEMGIALRKAAGRKVTTESTPVLPVPVSSRPSIERIERIERASFDSIPSTTSSRAPGEVAPTPASRPWTMALFGAVGAVVILIGLAAIFVWSRGAVSSGNANARQEVEGALPKAGALAAPAPGAPPESAVATAAPAPEGAGDTRAAAAASARTGPATSVPVGGAATPPRRRKAGTEPNNARDPGF